MTATFAPVRAEDAADQPLRVALDRAPNATQIALFVARERGFLAREGVRIEIRTAPDPLAAVSAVAGEQADIGLTRQPRLHLAIGQGTPIKRIATLVDTPLSGLIALEHGPIRQLADLAGRRVGFVPGQTEAGLLRAVLEVNGLGAGRVTLVELGESPAAALLDGQVDAVYSGERYVLLSQLEAAHRPSRLFPAEEIGMPPFDELVLVANRRNLNDPRLKRLMLALEQATLWTLNHPREAWATLVAQRPELDDEAGRRAWEYLLPRLAAQPGAFGSVRYKRLAAFLAGSRLITVVLPVSNYAVELGD